MDFRARCTNYSGHELTVKDAQTTGGKPALEFAHWYDKFGQESFPEESAYLGPHNVVRLRDALSKWIHENGVETETEEVAKDEMIDKLVLERCGEARIDTWGQPAHFTHSTVRPVPGVREGAAIPVEDYTDHRALAACHWKAARWLEGLEV